MVEITAITPDIDWIKVPFSTIYTSVFVVRTPDGTVLFDTASKSCDGDHYTIPALEQLGVTPQVVLISHNHGDHSGGLARIMEQYPAARVVTANTTLLETWGERGICACDGQRLFDVLQVVHIPGHTPDAIGLLDTRTGTLLSGDCLQAYGIYGPGAWGSNVRHISGYVDAISRLRTMPLQRIVTAHDYHPFQMLVEQQEIELLLDACIRSLRELGNMIEEHPSLADEQLEQLCNGRGLPRVGIWVIAGVRQAMEKGII